MKKLGLFILLLFPIIFVRANCASGTVEVPLIDAISVDIAGNVTLCWQPIADPDVEWYKIFRFDPFTGAFVLIDSVMSPATCYTLLFNDPDNNSDNESEALTVIATDICDNPSPVGVFHNTMHLESTPDPCINGINLDWNPYNDFNSGTDVLYNIYVSQDAGPYLIDGTSQTSDYVFNNVLSGSTYQFYIEAVEEEGVGPLISLSNDVTVNTLGFLKEPSPTYLFSVSVNNQEQIDLDFYVDTSADISAYRIMRALSPDGPYSNVGSVPFINGMNPRVFYFDNLSVDAINYSYYYRVEAVNTCGEVRDTSNIGRTIWLKVSSDSINGTNTLQITPYEGWLGSVDEYDIYRAVGGIWEVTPVGSIPNFIDTVTYVDDISEVFDGDGEFCYKVIARERSTPHIGVLPDAATSTSNESCVLHESLLYIPNAFAPFGSNTEFKPILTFANPVSYSFRVFNKWGQKVFETNNPDVSWNGRVNNTGNMSKGGAYIYVVDFESAFGDEFSKRGVVNLLR